MPIVGLVIAHSYILSSCVCLLLVFPTDAMKDLERSYLALQELFSSCICFIQTYSGQLSRIVPSRVRVDILDLSLIIIGKKQKCSWNFRE